MPYGTIGNLDRRITIKAPVETRGLGGAPEQQTWTEFATVWAAFQPGAGGESFVDDERRNRVTAKFMIRDIDGLNNTMRIEFDGQDWEIVSIMPTQRGRAIDIDAELVNYEPNPS
jgi:SPP1 family predicted phage head-tail adaptor